MAARLIFLAALLAVLAWAWTDWSPPGEFLASPGAVIQGHQKWERNCRECHKRFDRGEQPSLCVACHEDIRADIADGRFHSFMGTQPCSDCHPDHRGRDVRAVTLQVSAFDHDKTRYRLRDGHWSVECAKCHTTEKGGSTSFFARIALRCDGCHKTDDAHRGELSAACDDCHDASTWKRAAMFDHETTRFPLRPGKHEGTKCRACHETDHLYRVERRACVDCHRSDKALPSAHRERYGDECERCHSAVRWGEIRFSHDADTDYPLRARHRKARCAQCHLIEREVRQRNASYERNCAGCGANAKIVGLHRRVAGLCARCHQAATCGDIRAQARRSGDGDPGSEPAAIVRCRGCHLQEPQIVRQAGTKVDSDCVACHLKDDLQKGHKRAFGDRCEACHDETGWRLWKR